MSGLKDRLKNSRTLHTLGLTASLLTLAATSQAQTTAENPQNQTEVSQKTELQKRQDKAAMQQDIYFAFETVQQEYQALKGEGAPVKDFLVGDAVIKAFNAGLEGQRAKAIMPNLSEQHQRQVSYMLNVVAGKAQSAKKLVGIDAARDYIEQFTSVGGRALMQNIDEITDVAKQNAERAEKSVQNYQQKSQGKINTDAFYVR